MINTGSTILKPIKQWIRSLYIRLYERLPKPWQPLSKYDAELQFWEDIWKKGNNGFDNAWYGPHMLAMASETNNNFLRGKVVADFGCGPCGSLAWAKSAALRIGIDVNTDLYVNAFKENIISHGMVYVKSTEKAIPIPSNFIDVLFTRNAMDHVDNFELMSSEILRILKTGGYFIGSFNLEEKPTLNEPQCLNEDRIMTCLLNSMEVISYRVAKADPSDNRHKNIVENHLEYTKGEQGILWVKARRR